MHKTVKLFILVFLIGFVSVSAVSAKMYRWTGEDGTLHFTDKYYDVPEKYREDYSPGAKKPDINTDKGEVTGDGAGEAAGEAAASESSVVDEDKFKSYKNPNLHAGKDENDIVEWSIMIKDNAIYSSGTLFIGEGIVNGYTRRQTVGPKMATYSKYSLSVSGGSIKRSVFKVFEAKKSGENSWNNVLLVSNLTPGEYTVSLLPEILYIKKDGSVQIISGPSHYMEITN